MAHGNLAMTDRKKPTAGFWITVALVVMLVGYPLSIGPATWIESRHWTAGSHFLLEDTYRPVLWTARQCPEFLQIPLRWYLSIGLQEREHATFTEESIIIGEW